MYFAAIIIARNFSGNSQVPLVVNLYVEEISDRPQKRPKRKLPRPKPNDQICGLCRIDNWCSVGAARLKSPAQSGRSPECGVWRFAIESSVCRVQRFAKTEAWANETLPPSRSLLVCGGGFYNLKKGRANPIDPEDRSESAEPIMKNFGELFGHFQSRKSRSSQKGAAQKSAAAQRRRNARQAVAPERLEERLLLATDVYNQGNGLGETQYGWVVFTQTDAGDDIYVRETTGTDDFGTVSPRWQYSNNADFSDSGSIGPTSGAYRDILITDGVPNGLTGTFPSNFLSLPGAADVDLPSTLTPATYNFDTPNYDYISGEVVPGTFSGFLQPAVSSGAGFPLGTFGVRAQYLLDHFNGGSGDGVPVLFRDGNDFWVTRATFPVGTNTWSISDGVINYRTGTFRYVVRDQDGNQVSTTSTVNFQYASPVR
ncbi:MAG: hypothetical protein ACO3NZ_13345, partial [Pirellulales bacterium]